MYLSTPVSKLNTDPLMCWEELKPMYPSIYKLATKYLSGVCASVPSERLFLCQQHHFKNQESAKWEIGIKVNFFKQVR